MASGRKSRAGGRHLSTASTPTAATTSGWPSSSWPAVSRSTRWICAAAASPTASVSMSRSSPTTSATCDTLMTLAKSREPGLPVFLLGHSAGGVISCVYTLEHQAELAGLICESFAFQVPAPDFALAVLKGLSHLAPHAHVLQSQDRGLLARSRGRRGHERRSADRPRGAADADRRRDGPRRRAAQEGVSAHHAAGAHSSTAPPTRSRGRAAASSSTTTPAPPTRRSSSTRDTSTTCSTTSARKP